jgi:molybdopterin/thiamine biosynthesis adenylyltransferase
MRLDAVNLVGLGGIGSYLLPPLLKTLQHGWREEEPVVNLIDGDTVEEKNLDRQLFGPGAVGMPKVNALARRYEYRGQLNTHVEYLTNNLSIIPAMHNQVVCWVCCADNHIARRCVLQLVDLAERQVAIIAGNGTEDSDAYIYRKEWRDTPADPRVMFPEILTDNTGSPVHAAGCTGEEAIDNTPQLPMANFMAAAYALKLFTFHFGNKVAKVPLEYHPVFIRSNFSGITTQKHAECIPA